MCECRYYGKCAGNCDGHGLVLGFGNETYDCDDFQPMPDAEALVESAKEMVETFRLGAFTGEGLDAKWCRELHDKYARRIREALGVADG